MSQSADDIFESVSELPAAARAAALDAACGDDAELRAEVETMLRLLEHDSVGFLDRAPDVASAAMPGPPTEIGRYRVLRPLGEGSTGTVFEAEQQNPSRRVALKLLRATYAARDEADRLRFEGEILARLLHPGIAQVFEIGVFDGYFEKQPFLAMELVDGVRLDECWAAKTGSIETRLGLVLAICEAVDHAHRQGVVHRDLKPANILVTDAGQPKLLDFGIARLIDAEQQTLTVPTIAGLTGTLPYMSPEQVRGDTQLIDGRTDVYALGVITYQLLCGSLPLDLKSASLPEAARRIRDVEPVALGRVDEALRGDLSTVVATAMRKDPERRYQTVGEFASDLRRYLGHRPILARPATAWYLGKKFAQRNRAVVALACVVLLAVAAGVASSLRFGFEAREQARLAEDRARDSERRLRLARDSVDFLFEGVIEELPDYVGTSALLQDVLERGAAYYTELAREAPGDLSDRRKIWRAFGRLAEVHRVHGESERALEFARRFESLLAEAADELEEPVRLVDEFACAWLLCRLGVEGAHARVLAMIDPLLAALPDDPSAYEDAIGALIYTQQGTGSPEFNRAEALFEELRVLAPEHPGTLTLGCVFDDHRSNLCIAEGRPEEARRLLDGVVERLVALRAKNSTNPQVLNNLAIVRLKLGNLAATAGKRDAAVEYMEQSIQDARLLVAFEPDTAGFKTTLGNTLAHYARIAPLPPAEQREIVAEALDLLRPNTWHQHWAFVWFASVDDAVRLDRAAGQVGEVARVVEDVRREVRDGDHAAEGFVRFVERQLENAQPVRPWVLATMDDYLATLEDGEWQARLVELRPAVRAATQ